MYFIKYFIYSLLSDHIEAIIRIDNDESYKQAFNELLKEFSLYLETLDYCLDDKLHLMASTLGYTTLEEDFEKYYY